MTPERARSGSAPHTFIVRVCPECGQQQGEASATHAGECSNLGKMFVPREFFAVELDAVLEALREKSPMDGYGYCRNAADFLQYQWAGGYA